MEDKQNSPIEDRETIQFERLSEGIYAINYKVDKTSLKYTNEQILRALEQRNVKQLRDMSSYFFGVSGEYRRILHYFSHILTFDSLVVPKIYNQEFDENYQKNFYKILDYVDNSYIPENSRFITLITMVEGAFYGYERQLNNKVVLQQLPYNFCRSKFKINGVHAVEFDLRFFDVYKDIDQKIELFKAFPDEFLEYYLDYKENNGGNWVLLNPNFARCHKLTDDGVPYFSTILPELVNLKEYKSLDKSKDKMDLYRLIVQKLPVDKQTGLPLLKLEEGQALHKNAKKMISQEGVDVLTTPLDVDSVNLQERGQTVRDNIQRASNMVFDATGSSKLLFNGGSDGGSIGMSHSITVDESLMIGILDQFKRWYENKFSSLVTASKYSFEILFPYITIFNRDKMFDLFKEGATLGYSKLLPVVALGVKQSTFMNLMGLENDFMKLHEKMIPLSTSYTQSGKEGRPEKKEEDLSEKGIETRTTEANKNRAT